MKQDKDFCESVENLFKSIIPRRRFIKTSALLGSSFLLNQIDCVQELFANETNGNLIPSEKPTYQRRIMLLSILFVSNVILDAV